MHWGFHVRETIWPPVIAIRSGQKITRPEHRHVEESSDIIHLGELGYQNLFRVDFCSGGDVWSEYSLLGV